MVSCARSVVALGAVVMALASNPALAHDKNPPVKHLDNSDLLDLLDADLDEALLMKGVRNLQELSTMSPTPAPSADGRGIDGASAAPTVVFGETAAPSIARDNGEPSIAPVDGDGGSESTAPANPPTGDASGAMVWRPASAAMAVAAVVLAATAVMA